MARTVKQSYLELLNKLAEKAKNKTELHDVQKLISVIKKKPIADVGKSKLEAIYADFYVMTKSLFLLPKRLLKEAHDDIKDHVKEVATIAEKPQKRFRPGSR